MLFSLSGEEKTQQRKQKKIQANLGKTCGGKKEH
jgi:hypothetical protein